MAAELRDAHTLIMSPCRNWIAILGLSVLGIGACNQGERAATWTDTPVILISIDTLRSDHLPAYGYKGVATPAIDALRLDSVLFEHAYSNRSTVRPPKVREPAVPAVHTPN